LTYDYHGQFSADNLLPHGVDNPSEGKTRPPMQSDKKQILNRLATIDGHRLQTAYRTIGDEEARQLMRQLTD